MKPLDRKISGEALEYFMLDHCRRCIWFWEDPDDDTLVNGSCDHPCSEKTASRPLLFRRKKSPREDYRWVIVLETATAQDGISVNGFGSIFCEWFVERT